MIEIEIILTKMDSESSSGVESNVCSCHLHESLKSLSESSSKSSGISCELCKQSDEDSSSSCESRSCLHGESKYKNIINEYMIGFLQISDDLKEISVESLSSDTKRKLECLSKSLENEIEGIKRRIWYLVNTVYEDFKINSFLSNKRKKTRKRKRVIIKKMYRKSKNLNKK